MNSEQIRAYLQRIGYAGSLEPTLDTLKAIQQHQANCIPFETFDIAMGRPISLTFESIFNKLVKENRGGYCYELNALLYYALLALGFKACLCHARLLKDTSSVHMIIIVELDGLWLVDVGWGPGFTEPYLLDNIYRFKDLYEFTLDPCPLAFFEERNNYHQTSSDSCFAKKILCSLATCDGYLSLDGHLLTEHFAGKKTTTIISSDNEFRQILQNRFGLNLAINRPVWIDVPAG